MKTNTSLAGIASLARIALLCLGGALVARADQSQFVNAKVETRAVQNVQSAVSQIAGESSQPVWVAYDVPSFPGDSSCCNYRNDNGQNICGTCVLENKRGDHVDNNIQVNSESKTIKLEGSAMLTILFRVDQKRVMRIRIASANCTLDAGGLRVVWLTGVKSEDSVEYLTQYVKEKDGRERDSGDNLSEQAIMAIAQHTDPSADRAMASFVAPNQPDWLREKASFWLGAARGKAGLVLLEKMAKDDPSSEVRAKVAFALYVSREPAAVDDIIHMAKDDPVAHVRGQALFWLAQKAGQKAAATITGAIQDDPDTEVKKKAVFALSQMPKDEGIPKLIQVAQTNKNPEVRKQAMFWLGQSQDPRAVAFFEKILSQ
jgi:HEAT repeat protein